MRAFDTQFDTQGGRYARACSQTSWLDPALCNCRNLVHRNARFIDAFAIRDRPQCDSINCGRTVLPCSYTPFPSTSESHSVDDQLGPVGKPVASVRYQVISLTDLTQPNKQRT